MTYCYQELKIWSREKMNRQSVILKTIKFYSEISMFNFNFQLIFSRFSDFAKLLIRLAYKHK